MVVKFSTLHMKPTFFRIMNVTDAKLINLVKAIYFKALSFSLDNFPPLFGGLEFKFLGTQSTVKN